MGSEWWITGRIGSRKIVLCRLLRRSQEVIEIAGDCSLLLWLILLLREVAATGGLGRVGLLSKTVLLLSEAVLLLAESILLLPESALLLTIHLAGRGPYLGSADGRRLVRSAQQDILHVHHWVIDKHPLVVCLLLVINANRRIFAQAGDTHDCSAAKGLSTAGRVLRKG